MNKHVPMRKSDQISGDGFEKRRGVPSSPVRSSAHQLALIIVLPLMLHGIVGIGTTVRHAALAQQDIRERDEETALVFTLPPTGFGWKLYENVPLGFSIQLPPGWSVDEAQSVGEEVVFRDASMNEDIIRSEETSLSLMTWLKYLNQTTKAVVTPTVVDGAVWLQVAVPKERVTYIAVRRGGRFYTIMSRGPLLTNGMLGTLNFTDPATGWKRYVSVRFRIAFSLPNEWTVEQTETPDSRITIFPNAENPQDRRERIVVLPRDSVTPLPLPYDSAEVVVLAGKPALRYRASEEAPEAPLCWYEFPAPPTPEWIGRTGSRPYTNRILTPCEESATVQKILASFSFVN